jgi:hypothetical protein
VVWLLIAGLALGGCTESQRPEATGKGTIRAIHAVPSAPEVTFLIEERELGTLAYKTATSSQEFDDLTYDFSFDTRIPGSTSRSRIATQTVSILSDVDYVFVLTGTVASPSVLLWETDERQWDENETAFEVSAGHLAAGSGAIDIYFAETGTPPAAGNARGTLSFGERLAPFETESGEYVLTVTEQGDPSAVIFTSTARDYGERTSVLFAVQDADPSITSAISVRRIEQNGTSTELADPAFPPTRRFFNAAFGSGSMDVWLDDDFVTPLVSTLAYGAVSADVPVPAKESTYTYTAAGNPGAILLEHEDTVTGNTRGTNFVSGEPDDLDVTIVTDNRRPVPGLGRIRVTQMASQFDLVDAYVLAAGTDIADASPNLPRMAPTNSSGYLNFDPGNYELTVTEVAAKNVLAGPVPLDLASGQIMEIAIIDSTDPNLLNIVIYD